MSAQYTMNGVALLFAGIIAVALVYQFLQSETFQLKCGVSKTDGETYCVRKERDKDPAIARLSEVNGRLKRVVARCERLHGSMPAVQRLVSSFDPSAVNETLKTSELKAYSENKGEKIAMCLSKGDTDSPELIDVNTLTFIGLHELGHIATASIGPHHRVLGQLQVHPAPGRRRRCV